MTFRTLHRRSAQTLLLGFAGAAGIVFLSAGTAGATEYRPDAGLVEGGAAGTRSPERLEARIAELGQSVTPARARGALAQAARTQAVRAGSALPAAMEIPLPARAPVAAAPKKALLTGTTTASYFWDDGSGVRGDTGAPASGKPMRKGMFASPSWPMNTKVRVSYRGRSVDGFVGDRGPGAPSWTGIMLDLDTHTFRHLYDGGTPRSRYDAGVPAGHLKGLRYEVLEWGSGPGAKGAPRPFGSR
ncbi:septal ring lytic transglycosylase RlpA family protein [Spirillospora albida]|uniref:septal ring lytic transglycosylase RlpA family protein n=1 Tax=Spirillospora albida TaxID=58123 RepID=UPI000A542C88|nr:septal ring lytic transglycosylase RlpA family protein [Spirillospora albida]